jgi:hypothetical protein
MKKVVISAILFSALLLVTGVALATANNCTCYEVTGTSDYSATGGPSIWQLCGNDFNTDGDFGNLYIDFFSGDRPFNLTGNSNKWIGYGDGNSGCAGSWFFDIRAGRTSLNGIGDCEGERWVVHGHRVICPY